MGRKPKQTTEISPPVAGKRSRGGKTTWSQLAAIVTWLEVTANFNLVNGKATAGMKGCRSGEKLKQSDGFKQLAEFVNERCGTHWDGKTAGARYKAYKKKYKKTKRAILDPSGKKFCLSEKEKAEGINSIEKKIEKECAYFSRMDMLFGSKQNIVPYYTVESGHREATNQHSDDEDCSFVSDDESDKVGSSVSDSDDGSSSDSDDDDDQEGRNEAAAEALASLAASAAKSSEVPNPLPAVAVSSSSISSISNNATSSSDNEEGAKKRKSKKQKKDKEDKTALLPTSLKEKCADTVAGASNALELTAKITELKQLNKGHGRKDFSSTYSDTKAKELEFAREKFEFEKENFQYKREDDKEVYQQKRQDDRDAAEATMKLEKEKVILTELLRLKASREQIKEYLEFLT